MGISKRQGKILDIIVKEYINSAQPVSSQLVEKKHNLDICPATIRAEMQKLTEENYLYQPYTSAGRMPTDKGYRFFVNELLVQENIFEFEGFDIKDLFQKEVENRIKFIQSLTKNLAQISKSLVLSYLEGENIFWKEGWEEVLKEPEFREKDYIINFTKLLESIEKNIDNLNLNSEIKIYIGKEIPFKKIEGFSIISSKCYSSYCGEIIVSLLGPKRMIYDKNIGLINYLRKLLEEIY